MQLKFLAVVILSAMVIVECATESVFFLQTLLCITKKNCRKCVHLCTVYLVHLAKTNVV